MKIGILTFHCAHNYGAMLQTFATQEMLRAAGHDVKVIDYRPPYLTEPYRWFRASRIRKKDGSFSIIHLLAEIVLLPIRYVRYHRFNRFMTQRFNLSERVEYSDFKGDYDVIIIGSDQVWNLRQTRGEFDKMYVADFPFPKSRRIYIADAVSFEPDLIDIRQKEVLCETIIRFDTLSARESDMVEWLNEFSPKKFAHIQDPVFQLNPEKWLELTKAGRTKKPYLLLYRMMDHQSILPFANKLAYNLGLEVIEILSEPDALKLGKARQTVSVEDFLTLFAQASFVVTTSFHGTAFSLIFEKPFYTFDFENSKNLRIRSLLDSLHLNDRMLKLGAEVPAEVPIDYNEVRNSISIIRRNAADFILEAVLKVD